MSRIIFSGELRCGQNAAISASDSIRSRLVASFLSKGLDATTALVTVMWVNNETGAMQPIDQLCALTKEHGGVFHTDAVQAFGKVAINAKSLAFDLLSVSGHKVGAPKGVGAMFVRRGTPLAPLFFGGTQGNGNTQTNVNVFANMTNAFNRPNYGIPSGVMTSSNFGKSTNAGNPREIEVGMRFQF